MNARHYTLPAAWLLAACSNPDAALNEAPSIDSGPTVIPDAPSGPQSGGLSHEDDAGADLGERLSDAANAPEEPDSRSNGPGWDAFYDADAVHVVDIQLSEESWDALEDDGRVWAPAFVTVDGVEFPYAGVRRKGNTTWRSMSDKPSLKIKLEAFGEGPRLHGLERLTLNNMVSDPSQARENVALRIWWALGATASRASWATVTINGENYGLYSNIESIDDEWLERRYPTPGGDLWEANDDADFTPDGLPWWELNEGVGDVGRLADLADALERDPELPFEDRVGHLVNVEQFLRYWATCLVTGQTDGYPFKLNDAYVYSNPENGGRLDFFPWSMDESWGDNFATWTAGALAQACEDDDACEARRLEILDETLARYESLDIAGMVTASFATSAALVAEDPKKPFANAAVDAARADLRARIAGWPAKVRAEGY